MIESLNIFYILLAIILLWKGADVFVESSAKVASRLGVSQLVIGLTVVALGTSAPEFAVTINAALSGQSDISVSNVIGSNIFNLGLILGGVALIYPIKTDSKLVWRDGTVLIAATITILIFLWDLHLSRLEGLILVSGLVIYIFYLFKKREHRNVDIDSTPATGKDILLLLGGLIMIIAGGHLLKESALFLAELFGISHWVIGVTVIAAGTSAPELFTSLIAAFRGYHGISAGNLIGSDLFNLLGVLGLAGILSPLDVISQAHASIFTLVGMVILVVIMMRTGWRLSRGEGLVLIGINLVRWAIYY